MQHKLHEQLLFVSNMIGLVSLITDIPSWLVTPACLYCVADYVFSRMCAHMNRHKRKK